MRMKFVKLLAVAAAAAGLPSIARAAVSYTGAPYGENFDGLPSSGAATSLSATVGQQTTLSPTSFEGTKTGGTGSTFTLIADNGGSNTGALYSYGATGVAERALGTVASGSTIPAFGVAITNDSGAPLMNPLVSFTREQWRSSTSVANTIAFAYGLSGGTATTSNYLTDSSLTPFTALDLVGEAPVTTNGALDGNSASHSLAVSAAIPVTVNPGQTIFLRWTDTDNSGSDAGLALDGFSFSATPEPSCLGLIGVAGLLAFSRRRRRPA
jgi:hypothetical protein